MRYFVVTFSLIFASTVLASDSHEQSKTNDQHKEKKYISPLVIKMVGAGCIGLYLRSFPYLNDYLSLNEFLKDKLLKKLIAFAGIAIGIKYSADLSGEIERRIQRRQAEKLVKEPQAQTSLESHKEGMYISPLVVKMLGAGLISTTFFGSSQSCILISTWSEYIKYALPLSCALISAALCIKYTADLSEQFEIRLIESIKKRRVEKKA